MQMLGSREKLLQVSGFKDLGKRYLLKQKSRLFQPAPFFINSGLIIQIYV